MPTSDADLPLYFQKLEAIETSLLELQLAFADIYSDIEAGNEVKEPQDRIDIDEEQPFILDLLNKTRMGIKILRGILYDSQAHTQWQDQHYI